MELIQKSSLVKLVMFTDAGSEERERVYLPNKQTKYKQIQISTVAGYQ